MSIIIFNGLGNWKKRKSTVSDKNYKKILHHTDTVLIINVWRELMKVRLLAESPLVFEDHKVQGREMYEKSGTTVVHLLLEEGGVLPPVAQPDDVFIYVLEGYGKIRVGENFFDVEPDMLVKCPIDIPHGAENSGKDILKLLMVKMPTSTP